MKGHHFRTAATVGVLFAMLLPTACSRAATSGGSAANEITIGMPISLSGTLSGYDTVFLAGVQLAVADINSAGGVLGKKLRVNTADTKSDVSNTQNVALQVISDGANFVMPSVDYNYGAPAARAANSHNLIAITQTGDPRFGFQGIGPLAYNSNPATPTEGAAMAQFAYKQMHWQRPYLLVDQTIDYSKSLADFFQKSLQTLANKDVVVGNDTFKNDDPSIASQITRLQGTNPKPDVIVLSSFQPGLASAVKQIRAAGITTPILGETTFEGTTWLKGLGVADPNIYAPSVGINGPDEPNPTTRDILARAAKAQGSPVELTSEYLNGYGAAQILRKAIEKAGSIDTVKVQTALNGFSSVDIPGLGATTYTPTCHVPLGRPYIFIKLSQSGNQFLGEVKPDAIPPSTC